MARADLCASEPRNRRRRRVGVGKRGTGETYNCHAAKARSLEGKPNELGERSRSHDCKAKRGKLFLRLGHSPECKIHVARVCKQIDQSSRGKVGFQYIQFAGVAAPKGPVGAVKEEKGRGGEGRAMVTKEGGGGGGLVRGRGRRRFGR